MDHGNKPPGRKGRNPSSLLRQEWWNHLLNIKHGEPCELPEDVDVQAMQAMDGLQMDWITHCNRCCSLVTRVCLTLIIINMPDNAVDVNNATMLFDMRTQYVTMDGNRVDRGESRQNIRGTGHVIVAKQCCQCAMRNVHVQTVV